MSGEPFPKSSQLARGERRRSRHVATLAKWRAIRATKIGPCRVCTLPERNGGASAHAPYPLSFHHLVPRSLGGDDVADNIVPLCGDGTRGCHGLIEARDRSALGALATALTEAERAYIAARLGAGGMERLYGR